MSGKPTYEELEVRLKKLEEETVLLKMAEDALKASKATYEDLYENAPDMFLSATVKNQRIIQCNQTIANVLGYGKQKLIGRELASIYHPDCLAKMEKTLTAFVKTGIVKNAILQLKTKDDEKIDVSLNMSAVYDDAGSIVYSRSVFRDITELKKTEDALINAYSHLEHRVQKRTRELARTNERLHLESSINSTLAEMARKVLIFETITEISDFILKQILDITGSEFGYVGHIDPETGWLVSPTLTKDIWETCQVDQKDFIFKHFNGLFGWVLKHKEPLVTNTPSSDPRAIGIPEGHLPIQRFLSVPALMGENLVGQISIANAKKDYTSKDLEIAQRMADLYAIALHRKQAAAELLRSKESAVAANQAKSDFLASMSHELRTPLNAIIGFAEVLKDQFFGNLNDKQAEYIEHIMKSGRHLLALINDILDLSKIEAGKMPFEPEAVDVRDLLEASLLIIREKAQKHGIDLTINISPRLANIQIEADDRKVKQIMFNLLSNAAKFTLEGGAIQVNADMVGSEVIVEVRDTGVGIAPEDQARIFEDFYQVQGGVQDKTPGTGLGLSLVKRLVEMHGGRVWLESEGLGKGSSFKFTLPLLQTGQRREAY